MKYHFHCVTVVRHMFQITSIGQFQKNISIQLQTSSIFQALHALRFQKPLIGGMNIFSNGVFYRVREQIEEIWRTFTPQLINSFCIHVPNRFYYSCVILLYMGSHLVKDSPLICEIVDQSDALFQCCEGYNATQRRWFVFTIQHLH